MKKRALPMVMSGSRAVIANSAAEYIRNKIVLGEYAAGMPLIEEQLARECSVSRGSVRTALQELESEGLVFANSNGRKIVTNITPDYVDDLYRVRTILEKEALHTILSRTYASDADYISSVVAPISAELSQVFESLASADAMFHRKLVLASKNNALIQCWKIIEPVVWSLQVGIALYTELDYESLVLGRHNRIFRMLVERNSDIFKEMEVHIDSSRAATYDLLINRKCGVGQDSSKTCAADSCQQSS